MMKKLITLIAFSLLIATLIYFHSKLIRFSQPKHQDTIKVGVLYSLSGSTAIDEKQIVNATLLAIDEINKKGGILGKKIEPIMADGKSNAQVFISEAERLLKIEHVPVIFGCWTSAHRKNVQPIIEKNNGLLFYSSQYAGVELSPNIVYTGSVPNQQMFPGIRWSYMHLGKRFFLIGSDYIYPRISNKIMSDFIKSINAEIAGEEYLPLESTDVEPVIKKIINTQPTVILSTLVGATNSAFFKALRKAGIEPEKIPTLSFSLTESDITEDNLNLMIGDYICGSYFQNISSEANRKFLQDFTKKYGSRILLSDTEASYYGPFLWAQAVERAQSTEPMHVKVALKNQAYNAPEGIVHIDPETQHTWKYFRIGKIQFNGQFNIFWESYRAIKPLPYPTMFASREKWDEFVDSFYKLWGNRWEKPQIS